MASPSDRPVRASLFVTCIIDQLYPEVGESVVRVLKRLGVELDFPETQTCCGQPAFNSGFWSEAKPLARRFLETFSTSDRYIVIPSGSCGSMVRVFYQELFHDDPALLAKAQQIAPRVYEFSEFVVDVLGATERVAEAAEASSLSCWSEAKHLREGGTSSGKGFKTTYHEACHLRRELGAKTQARKLLKALPGVELVEMEQSEVCCGFGGTFAVKYADISGAMLGDKVKYIKATGADAVVACDSSCLMHIGGGLDKQGVNVRPLHLAQVLDQAMG